MSFVDQISVKNQVFYTPLPENKLFEVVIHIKSAPARFFSQLSRDSQYKAHLLQLSKLIFIHNRWGISFVYLIKDQCYYFISFHCLSTFLMQIPQATFVNSKQNNTELEKLERTVYIIWFNFRFLLIVPKLTLSLNVAVPESDCILD